MEREARTECELAAPIYFPNVEQSYEVDQTPSPHPLKCYHLNLDLCKLYICPKHGIKLSATQVRQFQQGKDIFRVLSSE